jgi:hypothetical protein
MNIKSAKGMFPSVKAGGPIYYKTHMQHHYLLVLEFDQSVVEIEHQPLREQIDPRLSSRKIYPDFLVLRELSAELVFLVYESLMQGDGFDQKRAALMDFCATQKLDFVLVTDKWLYSDNLVANLRFLHQFSRYTNDLEQILEREILAFMDTVRESSIEEIAHTIRPCCPRTALIPIYNMIWRQVLAVPIREESISTQTLVSLLAATERGLS